MITRPCLQHVHLQQETVTRLILPPVLVPWLGLGYESLSAPATNPSQAGCCTDGMVLGPLPTQFDFNMQVDFVSKVSSESR